MQRKLDKLSLVLASISPISYYLQYTVYKSSRTVGQAMTARHLECGPYLFSERQGWAATLGKVATVRRTVGKDRQGLPTFC